MGQTTFKRTTPPYAQESAKVPPPDLGDRLPEVVLADHRNQKNALFTTLRGKGALLLFMPSVWDPSGQAILRRFVEVFDRLDPFVSIHVITRQPRSKNAAAVAKLKLPFAVCADEDGNAARIYDVTHNLVAGQPVMGMAAFTVVLSDINGRILHIARNTADPAIAEEVAGILEAEAAEPPREMGRMAPVLFVPRALEPQFCQRLIDAYLGGKVSQSGFYLDTRDGGREHRFDDKIKVRRDHLPGEALVDEIWDRLTRRVVPEIYKAFHFKATQHDTFKIGCYDGETGGHFRVHRDNDTPSGMYRRFAMSLNLNTGDYDGGYLRFPEHGPHLYRPAAGEAVIFSCSLLHEATPVTRGTRYVLLGFLFGDDDVGAYERRVQKVKTTYGTSQKPPRSAAPAASRHRGKK